MSINYEGVNVYATEEFVLGHIGHIPTELDAINLLSEAGVVDYVTDKNGEIFTSNTGEEFIL